MLPEGWKVSTVGRALSIQNELRKPISAEIREKNVGPYAYYGPTKAQGFINTFEQNGRFCLIGEDGDHFLKFSTLSMTKIISGKCTVNNHAHILSNSSKCIIDWFFYYFMHRDISSHLTRQGAGRYKLTKKALEKLPILLPPLPEQKKIAAILLTWDRAIEGTEKLLANSQQQKKALMQQLLTGKNRLPGFTGEWKTKQINEIANRIKRTSDGEKHPILMISSSIGFVTQDAKYSRYMAGESVSNYILLKEGEFAYNKGNSKLYQFGCVFELREYKQGLVPNVYVCFKVNSEQHPAFYRHLFKFDFLKPQLRAIVNSGIRNNGLLNIKPDQFMNTKVPVPPLPEQKAIAAVLTTADEEITALESDLTRLRQEKKALMQQLLTGKRRVTID